MAIQDRRGPENELDKSKLLPGETATTLDTKKIFHAFAPGDVHQMATVEEMHTAIEQVTEDIRQDFTEQVEEATDNANTAADYATTQGDYAKAQGDYAYEKGQEAQTIVDSAAPVINTNLQATYADKGTITGPSVQFPTADNGLIEITNIQGKYSQAVTVQGKQLFDKAKVSAVKYIQPVTGTETTSSYNNNASAKIYTGTETNVTISGQTFVQPNTPVGIAFYNSSNARIGGTSYQNATGNGTYAIPAGTFYLRYTINNVDLNTSQAEFGTIATPYAAFVPNSPSPDYPSVIHNVGDVPFNVVANMKNWLKTYLWSVSWSTQYGVSIAVSSDGIVTLNGTATSSFLWRYNTLPMVPGTYSLSMNNLVIGHSGTRIQITDSAGILTRLQATSAAINGKHEGVAIADTVVQFWIRCESGQVYNNFTFKPQLERNPTATTYEPYKGNQTPVSDTYGALPDGTKDEFISDGSTAKKIQRKARIVFDGSSDENWVKTTTNVAGRVRFSISVNDKKINDNANSIICDRLTPIGYAAAWGSPPILPSISGHNTNNTINVYGTMFDNMSVTDFKTWIAANTLTVDYALATPIESPRDRIFLTSYSGITNVYTTDPLQPTFTAVAKSELWSKTHDTKDSGVSFTEASVLGNINSGETHATIFGKIKRFFSLIGTTALTTAAQTITGAINELVSGKINKTDIVNTDTVNDTTKVASAAVARVLGMEIDTVNNNLVTTSVSSAVTISNGSVSASMNKADYTGKSVTLHLIFTVSSAIAAFTGIGTLISSIPKTPSTDTRFVLIETTTHAAYTIYIGGNGRSVNTDTTGLPVGTYFGTLTYTA